MPLSVPPLLPAEIVPSGIGLVAAIILVRTVIKSLLARRHRLWTIGVLTVVIAAAYVFWFQLPELPGFLHGLRDRFVLKVGYPTMREFAKEVSLVDAESALCRPGMGNVVSAKQKERWDDLVSRYPFLDWAYGAGAVVVRGGLVETTWGSALTGHWGFEVAPGGKVKDPEEDHCRILRVSEDILFVNYFD
jgi:hypothetical protein